MGKALACLTIVLLLSNTLFAAEQTAEGLVVCECLFEKNEYILDASTVAGIAPIAKSCEANANIEAQANEDNNCTEAFAQATANAQVRCDNIAKAYGDKTPSLIKCQQIVQ